MSTCTLPEPASPRILHLTLTQLITVSDSDGMQLYKDGEKKEASFQITTSDCLPELCFQTILVRLVFLVVCFSVFS